MVYNIGKLGENDPILFFASLPTEFYGKGRRLRHHLPQQDFFLYQMDNIFLE